MCDALERIADSLPDRVDLQACTTAAGTLCEVISGSHRLEETSFFTALEAYPHAGFDTSTTLARLRLEHVEDACFAEEISEVLFSYGRGAPAQNSEATGYMLRAFFKTVRRHVAIEEELLDLLVDEAESH